jgi:prolyl-tRNA synthetase
MLDIYADCCEKLSGGCPSSKATRPKRKSSPPAVNKYTIECMMHDHKALQSGTSHYFGDGFARAFEHQL